MTNELYHYGKGHLDGGHSGRYPWGSGDDPCQHTNSEFYETYRGLTKDGFSTVEIADYFGMTVSEVRSRVTISREERKQFQVQQASQLKEHGYSPDEAAKIMGVSTKTYYNILNGVGKKRESTDTTIERLKEELKTKDYLDVGSGSEIALNVSEERLKAILGKMEEEGYLVANVYVEQATNPGKKTTVKVLAPPNTSKNDIYDNLGGIKTIDNYNPDMDYLSEATKTGIVFPKAIDGSRVYIRYAEDTNSTGSTGADLDGTIELRRGVEDISLQGSKYSQIRVNVDDKYYLKGVGVYRDDIPEGYDIVFNTHKHEGTPAGDVFKKLKTDKDGNIDADNPFGATIKKDGQSWYIDENGNKQLSVINKVNDEGDWGEWSKSLSSQFLSKQSLKLAERQLDIAYKEKLDEYDEIMSVTNPVVKKVLLEQFSSDCDSACVDLKAAALPGQATKLLLPCNTLKENEIYNPSLPDGTTVYLIRYPHAGTFEIPTLVVNNKNGEGKSLIGNSDDAVGINIAAAKQLSGADFDGDTAVIIPAPKEPSLKIKADKYYESLKNFDADKEYAAYEGMTPVKDQKGWNKQMEMGKITNLIMDMTLQGATEEDLVKAVKHSMVIIDAEKHNLDWQKSYEENDISELKLKYRGSKTAGAATLITKAGKEIDVNERKQTYLYKDIDKETGRLLYNETGRFIKEKVKDENGDPVKDPVTGKNVYETTSKRAKEKAPMMQIALAETGDARTLSSGHAMEELYANYANNMYALANKARLDYVNITTEKADPEAAKTYALEVDSLNTKLQISMKNAPKERQAQIIARVELNAKVKANPELTDKDHKSDYKRLKSQLLTGARLYVGAERKKVTFTYDEWDAIQAKAISPTKLEKLLRAADMDTVKKLAMPRKENYISSAKEARIRSLALSGYSLSEIADAVGVSTSSVSSIVNGKE